MDNRPDVLPGTTTKVRTGCGSLYVTVNDYEGKPCELFLRMGKSGGCAHATTESIGRLGSALMQRGADIDFIIKQLGGVSCHADSDAHPSCPDAVARVLKGLEKKDAGEA